MSGRFQDKIIEIYQEYWKKTKPKTFQLHLSVFFSSKCKMLLNSFSVTKRDKFYVKEVDGMQIMIKPCHLLSARLISHIHFELKILFSRFL